MRAFVLILLAISSVAIAYATLLQTYILLWKPERYVIDREDFYRWPKLKRIRHHSVLIGCFIGIGFMIFKGVEAALWFIPHSWTFQTDGGEREWLVHGLAFTSAFVLSGFVLEKLGSLASERVSKNRR